MSQAAIEIEGVEKRFGRTEVLRGLSLSVPPGRTFAFLGRNGAGKTTTIRMLLGLLRPDAGRVRVLGLDPLTQALEVRQRVGYLAEDQQMFGWMRVSQVMGFIAPFYPTWDADLARRLAERFELAMTTRVRHLSKGQNVRLGLLLALAHHPELVILDDPTLGLDPIMRKEFLRDVVVHLQGEGRTVFFSSHLLYEVEPVADAVAILDRGRIVRQAATEELRAKVKRLVLPAEDWAPPPEGGGSRGRLGEALGGLVLDVRSEPRTVGVVVEDVDAALAAIRRAGGRAQGASGEPPGETPGAEVVDLNLDEIFEAYVIGKREVAHGAQPDLERVA